MICNSTSNDIKKWLEGGMLKYFTLLKGNCFVLKYDLINS